MRSLAEFVGGLTALLGAGTFVIRLATLVTGVTLLSKAWRDRKQNP